MKTTRLLRVTSFFGLLITAVHAPAATPPYPQSPVIKSLTWYTNVLRLAPGAGDNWPITWIEDDLQITALGDGPGFSKRKPRLSLGFARITGDPPNVSAADFASDVDTPEGGGSRGIKASGLLLVDGVLYMWVRNYKPPGSDDFTNARLAWSANHGTNWIWADWHFADTFGCPEFIQFGKNYGGARDEHVYVASQANDSAYGYSPDIVLARVPKDKVRQRASYEFFAGLDAKNQPRWSTDIAQRKPIFTDANGTQRIAITHNAPLRRYILTTSHRPPGSTATHTPALGIFDAPEPWGPWTTVHYDDRWSGTNRTYHHKFPTKWMSPDGRTMWLLFSGLDGGYYTFCLKKATLSVAGQGDRGASRTGAGKLEFMHHFIDRELPVSARGAGDYGLTALADLDRDGDLDFVLGGRAERPSHLYWFEYQAADRWIKHSVGTNYLSDVGLAALDVDGDGWNDLVCSGVWFRNTGQPRTQAFQRFVFDPNAGGAHDVLTADVDGDGKLDILLMGDERTQLKGLFWFKIPKDPTQRWDRHLIGPGVHGAITPVGAADLDGDGDMDIVRADTWFENRDGEGREWMAHRNIPMGRAGPYGVCVRAAVLDMDGDGKRDIVMADADITDSKVVVLRNVDGKGGQWSKQELPQSFTYGSLHALAVADMNNDGRPDIIVNEQEELLPPGRENPRWVIWENLGEGQFAERIVLDAKLGGHELVVGDVDGDGVMDICSKPWGPRPWNGNGGKMHVDFLENRLIRKSD